MKIHHSEKPLEDRIAHVLRNDRERTGQFIADTLGINKTGRIAKSFLYPFLPKQ